MVGRTVSTLSERQRSLAFATVMLAFTMDVVDATIVNTAIPAIQRELGAGANVVQWVVAGYFLAFAILLVAGGRLGDLYGYRRMFLVGVTSFTVASLGCGLARTGEELVAARMLQGATAALMAPQVMALVQLMYTPVERVSRLAFFGVVGGVAAIGGPILGGLLIELDAAGLGWRLIFLINGPIGLAAIVAGWKLLPTSRSPHALRVDGVGTLLLALALGSLLFPLIQAPEYGWPLWCFAMLAGSAPVLAMFWQYERGRVRRIGSALIAPELFHQRSFSLGLIATVLFGIASTGFLLVLSVTLQHGLGYTPLEVALVHIPFGLGVMAGISLIGRRWLTRLGRTIPATGAVLMAAGVGLVTGATVLLAGATMPLVAALTLTGIGMGMVAGPLPAITLAPVDRGHAGVAGGTHKAVQQIGGALGGALVGALYFVLAGDGAEASRHVAAFAPSMLLVLACLGAAFVTALLLPQRIFGSAPVSARE